MPALYGVSILHARWPVSVFFRSFVQQLVHYFLPVAEFVCFNRSNVSATVEEATLGRQTEDPQCPGHRELCDNLYLNQYGRDFRNLDDVSKLFLERVFTG